MAKTKVVVYGLSTEGYSVACRMALAGGAVSIIDEATPSAIPLTPEIAKTYPTVAAITEDEPILPTAPVNETIADADYLFFGPQMRKSGQDTRTELSSKFKDAASAMGKGTSFVYCAPTGIGGNNENISLLEHMTGHEAGHSMSYFYCPLGEAGSVPGEIGSYTAKVDERLDALLSTKKGAPRQIALGAAERFYAVSVLSRFARMCSVIEVCRNVQDDETRSALATDEVSSLYLHDMMRDMYDLRSLSSSFEGAGTLAYLVNGGIKGIEGYIKRLTGEVRATLKRRELKAARTRVAISWTLDKYEMRGERMDTRLHLVSRLRDYIGDVGLLGDSTPDVFDSDKTLIVIACSERDTRDIPKNDGETIVIRANPLFESS